MKHAGAAALIIGTLALAGCGGGSSGAHKTPSAADNRLAYIIAVRAQLGLDEYTDKQLTDFAKAECKMLDTGSTQADVIDATVDTSAGNTYDRQQIAYWVGAAKGTC